MAVRQNGLWLPLRGEWTIAQHQKKLRLTHARRRGGLHAISEPFKITPRRALHADEGKADLPRVRSFLELQLRSL